MRRQCADGCAVSDRPFPDLALARSLFDALAEKTCCPSGYSRPSYGDGEQIAHDLVRQAAAVLGLESATDAAGNLCMTLRGRDGSAPPIVVGSHLDSVPHGGNYDGAAGVIAGLAAAAGLCRAGIAPSRDVMIMAIRAEESTWFPSSYIGSRAALGLLPAETLDTVVRSDTGRTLAEHMAVAGFDPEAVRRGRKHFSPAALGAFIEVHIEQGPVLEQSGTPLGIVTGIRGGLRYRTARCLGAYGHSGAEPRRLRRDAVFAMSHLVVELDALWREMEAAGADVTITVGQFTTDPEMHAFSKVPGEVRFSLDVRSQSVATMDEVHRRFLHMCELTAEERGVRFELGPLIRSTPALMDDTLRARMVRIAHDLGIPALEMASGAGHDAAVFANSGVPTAMLFIRNANGSHNPDEAMAMEDFATATTVLIELLASA